MSKTLLVDCWEFNRFRKTDQNLPPFNIDGTDLYDFVAEELDTLKPVKDQAHERWSTLNKWNRVGARAFFLDGETGHYGDPGNVIDVPSGRTTLTLTEDHATTATTRALIVIPDEGMHAFAFYERSGARGASGLEIRKELQRLWRERSNRAFTWKCEWLIEPEAWLESVDFKAVEVRRYAGNSGTANSSIAGPDEYVFGAQAGRSKFLPRKQLKDILEDQAKAYGMLGVSVSPEDGDRVYVEVRDPETNRQKKYEVSGGSLPKIQRSIGATNDKDFINECVKYAGDLFPRMGRVWKNNWTDD